MSAEINECNEMVHENTESDQSILAADTHTALSGWESESKRKFLSSCI